MTKLDNPSLRAERHFPEGTQCHALLAHLLSGRSINYEIAFRKYGISSLQRRIADLGAKGIEVKRVTRSLKITGGGKLHYKEYRYEPQTIT